MDCKLRITLFFILFSFFSIAQNDSSKTNPNGHNIFYYPNGKISSEGNFVNGKPEGIWKSYYESGKVKSEGARKNNQPDGPWKFYNSEGILTGEYIYVDGKKSGKQIQYYNTGKIKSEENLKDGVRDGLYKEYGENGTIAKQVPYLNGVENGIAKEFAEDGRIVTISTFKDGYLKREERINGVDKFGFKQGLWKDFYDNDALKTEAQYRDDKRNGSYKEYALNGTITKNEKYKNGDLVIEKVNKVKLEVQRDYFDNGKAKSSVNVINGKKEGALKEFDASGNITAGKLYRNNKLVGEGITDETGMQQGLWKYFYDDGSIRSEGKYKDGKKTEEWKFFFNDNSIQQIGKYENDLPVSEWKWYFRNGKLRREETFIKGKEEGLSSEYNDSLKRIATGNYVEGKKDGVWKYNNGEYVAEGEYRDGNLSGEWKQIYLNGKLAFKGTYFEGMEEGEHLYYYETGKLKEQRYYKKGFRNGLWKYYDEDGALILSITFEGDKESKVDKIKIN